MNSIRKIFSSRTGAYHPGIVPGLKEIKAVNDLGPWYHDWWEFGIANEQRAGIFRPNQQCKEHFIRGYLEIAVAKSRKHTSDLPSVLELFCADGYYSFWAKRFGAGHVIGLDRDEEELNRARVMGECLGYDDAGFIQGDVHDAIRLAGREFDVVLCTGGLYHVSDPVTILEICHRLSLGFLVVQTVVTKTTDDEDYFVSPAPGQDWGCRFTAKGLLKMLSETGWHVLEYSVNELEANIRPDDRGSLYALCSRE